ncbi:unnamed protein product, partial [Meganyctiphanes norvegica]
MVRSNQDGFSVCIECYMVFYSAEGAKLHMKSHIKHYGRALPKFCEFRKCCRQNARFCLEPMIICGEPKCYNRIPRTASSLTRHRSIHSSVYWWNRWNESHLIKGLKCRDPKTYLRSTLCLLDSVDSTVSADNNIDPTNSAKSKRETVKQDEVGKDEICDNDNGNTKFNIAWVYGGGSAVKICPPNEVITKGEKTVNNVISEMQQTFCNTTDTSENSFSNEKEPSKESSSIDLYKYKSNQIIHDIILDETGKKKETHIEEQPQTWMELFKSSASSGDLHKFSKSEGVDKSIKNKDVKDVPSALQKKYNKSQFFVKPKREKAVNSLLFKMQQKFCNTTDSSTSSTSKKKFQKSSKT